MRPVNSHILKLSGKAELPKPMEGGRNYHVSLSGSVPTITEIDNENGSVDRIYTFRAIKVELLDELGEVISLRDTRSKSQLFRACIWKAWKDAPGDLTFDEYYEKLMNNLIRQSVEIVKMYGPELY